MPDETNATAPATEPAVDSLEIDGSELGKIILVRKGAAVQEKVEVKPEEVEKMPELDVEKLKAEILGSVAEVLKAKDAEAEKLKAEKAELAKRVEVLEAPAPKSAPSEGGKSFAALTKEQKVEVLQKAYHKGELAIFGYKRGALRGAWNAKGRAGPRDE